MPNQGNRKNKSTKSYTNFRRKNLLASKWSTNLSQINARLDVGQVLTDGGWTSAGILAHDMQYLFILPWSVNNEYIEDTCIDWCGKFDGMDTFGSLALHTQAWEISVQREAPGWLHSMQASISS